MYNHQTNTQVKKNVAISKINWAILSALLIATLPPSFAKRTVLVPLPSQTTVIKESFQKPFHQPKIQLAILLDTSSSMNGLIDQTRNQIWQVVNEFSTAKRNGIKPILEVALFEYGNDGITQESGFVRKLSGFTRELDGISEGLFKLTTNGGSEYCGYAIQSAVNGLQWSHHNSDIKSIFIAGNEPFTQGPVNYKQALNLAKQKGITVNTIHAGNYQTGVQTGWQTGAQIAGGDYMSIDTNQKVVHVNAPQDKVIAELNTRLNQTYVPYGTTGKTNKLRQDEQDKLSNNISSGLLAKRAKSKSSSFYNNSDWDLVDAFKDGKMDEAELATLEASALPEPMKAMSAKQKKEYVVGQARQRAEIQKEIAELSNRRDQYVAEEKRKQVAAAPSVSDALTQAIKKQAQKKDYKFEK
jgi:hypothetical protein